MRVYSGCQACTLHYITLSAIQMPPTPKVTSGASTITCYTKYNPPAQHAVGAKAVLCYNQTSVMKERVIMRLQSVYRVCEKERSSFQIM